jgi:heme a synthase
VTRSPHAYHGEVRIPTRPIFVIALVAQAGIVVTGGAVRITGSGLGCPTWPQCTPGSYGAQLRQPEGYHALIEFGNRLLTLVVSVAVLAAIAATISLRHRRRHLIPLAVAQLLGVLAQAVLGGITVLTDLNPATVAAHFMLSIGLIAVAVALVERSAEGDGPPHSVVHRDIRRLVALLVGCVVAVVVLGTVVTGSGPHSGDARRPARFAIDPATISLIHADLAIVTAGLAVAVLVALRITDAPTATRRRSVVLMGVILAQGLVGYVQYFTGLPAVLVMAHLAGACALWIATLRLYFATRSRGTAEVAHLSHSKLLLADSQ